MNSVSCLARLPFLEVVGGAESANPLITGLVLLAPAPCPQAVQGPTKSHLININSCLVDRGSLGITENTSLTSVTREIPKLGALYQGLGTKTKCLLLTIWQYHTKEWLSIRWSLQFAVLSTTWLSTQPWGWVSSATCRRNHTVESLTAEKFLSAFLTGMKQWKADRTPHIRKIEAYCLG